MKKERIKMFMVVALIIGLAVFLGRMPVLATDYGEAPMLRTMVAAGELPPVEERLPDEPVVVQPAGGEIGVYGGSMITTFWPTHYMNDEYPIIVEAPEYLKPIPNIAKAWEINEDATEVTFYLRKGMKWSDGAPFTADDWLFWYNDIEGNEELTPIRRVWYKIGEEFGKLTKIDNYTIKWIFPVTFGSFFDSLCIWPVRGRQQFAPAHYLKQFHADYVSTEELEKKMKEGGYDTWMDLFGSQMNDLNNPELPVIGPWVVRNERYSDIQVWERNAYFWKVDPEGNQLPYIDYVKCPRSAGFEANLLRLIAGEIDYSHTAADLGALSNFTIVMENREKGNYRGIRETSGVGSSHMGVIYPNVSHKDPVKRELFNNLDFRKALSVAINRQEIVDIVQKGQAIPSQVAPAIGPPYYGEAPEFKGYYTQYDPELANQLLDSIGLTEWDNSGYRLGLDGKKLLIVLQVVADWIPEMPLMADMYRGYWAEVGLNTIVKPVPETSVGELVNACEHDIFIRYFSGGARQQCPANSYLFPRSAGWHTAPKWARWILTDGKQGEEPPDWVKRLAAIDDEAKAEVDTEKRVALYNEAVLLHVNELLPIGLSGRVLDWVQYIFNNRIKNVPERMDLHMVTSQLSSWYIPEELQ